MPALNLARSGALQGVPRERSTSYISTSLKRDRCPGGGGWGERVRQEHASALPDLTGTTDDSFIEVAGRPFGRARTLDGIVRSLSTLRWATGSYPATSVISGTSKPLTGRGSMARSTASLSHGRSAAAEHASTACRSLPSGSSRSSSACTTAPLAYRY